MGPFPNSGAALGTGPMGLAREKLSDVETSPPSDPGPSLPSPFPPPSLPPSFLSSFLSPFPLPTSLPSFFPLFPSPSPSLPFSHLSPLPSPFHPPPPWPWSLENRREVLWALRQHPVWVRSLGWAPARPCYFIVHNHSHRDTKKPTGLESFQHWVSIGVKSCLTKLIQDDAPEEVVGSR